MYAPHPVGVNQPAGVSVLMVTTESGKERFVTIASNGRATIQLDAPIAKGGGGLGFGPHELLEASIGACISMAVRMHAVAHQVPLEGVAASVRIVRPDESTVRFEHTLHLRGPLTDVQREALTAAAESCPVRQTLSRHIEFRAQAAATAVA
jgi:putative redox protein